MMSSFVNLIHFPRQYLIFQLIIDVMFDLRINCDHYILRLKNQELETQKPSPVTSKDSGKKDLTSLWPTHLCGQWVKTKRAKNDGFPKIDQKF